MDTTIGQRRMGARGGDWELVVVVTGVENFPKRMGGLAVGLHGSRVDH